MIDVDGNKHLDCCNNVAAVGHAHPAVVQAGQQEIARIFTNSRFLNEIQQRYLSKVYKIRRNKIEQLLRQFMIRKLFKNCYLNLKKKISCWPHYLLS